MNQSLPFATIGAVQEWWSIRARATKIITDHLGVDRERVIDSATFYGDLNADSLDTIELVMALEEEFGIEIPDDEAEQVTTVGECIAALERRMAGKVATP